MVWDYGEGGCGISCLRMRRVEYPWEVKILVRLKVLMAATNTLPPSSKMKRDSMGGSLGDLSEELVT